ncbi:hypothetical protein [Cupriavidus sp. SW-Y-13]|uniref:hypothetical protein n=1 Tax=Cupriavidus sp. SW-Y-13 TaxID=2653854 RepID=UPI0013661D19|nr:hypothetical protein [Cupriavidus sp. SW-Y-13]MWL91008.1 hypothetical protein [Cupriavidus sp. SW-Y-13]
MQKLRRNEMSEVICQLSRHLDFKIDLPGNVFKGYDFDFFFFERPLFDFSEVFFKLITENFRVFDKKMYVKFSGEELLEDSCLIVNKNDVNSTVEIVEKYFSDFMGGKVGYPIILFNAAFDWISFESSREEIGVIAVKKSTKKNEFMSGLESDFISIYSLLKMRSGSGAESLTARSFLRSYALAS